MVSEGMMHGCNPWWQDARAIGEDPEIRKWDASPLRHDPALRGAIDLDDSTNVVYTLRGPRQVGKTTLVKLQIRDLLLSRGVEPWRILYYALDAGAAPADIIDLVDAYRRSVRQGRDPRSYVFLDEASSVRGWQKAVKSLYDRGALENHTVVVTGSQALNLKKDSERLPGRRGSPAGPHGRVLLPMKFSEFARAKSPALARAAGECGLARGADRFAALDSLARAEIPPGVRQLGMHRNELDDLLDEYLVTGGTPRVVGERARAGTIPRNTYAEYLEGVLGDWDLEGKSQKTLKEILAALIASVGSQSSWAKIARDTDAASAGTVGDYVDTLRRLFMVNVFHPYNVRTGLPLTRKQKKVHFADPFYLHMFNSWLRGGDPFEGTLAYLESGENKAGMVEGVVGSHLARIAFDRSGNQHLFDQAHGVFYWRGKGGREVDYVVGPGGAVPVEVKYRRAPRSLGGLYEFQSRAGAGGGIVVTRGGLEAAGHYSAVPAPLFLMLA